MSCAFERKIIIKKIPRARIHERGFKIYPGYSFCYAFIPSKLSLRAFPYAFPSSLRVAVPRDRENNRQESIPSYPKVRDVPFLKFLNIWESATELILTGRSTYPLPPPLFICCYAFFQTTNCHSISSFRFTSDDSQFLSRW